MNKKYSYKKKEANYLLPSPVLEQVLEEASKYLDDKEKLDDLRITASIIRKQETKIVKNITCYIVTKEQYYFLNDIYSMTKLPF